VFRGRRNTHPSLPLSLPTSSVFEPSPPTPSETRHRGGFCLLIDGQCGGGNQDLNLMVVSVGEEGRGGWRERGREGGREGERKGQLEAFGLSPRV